MEKYSMKNGEKKLIIILALLLVILILLLCKVAIPTRPKAAPTHSPVAAPSFSPELSPTYSPDSAPVNSPAAPSPGEVRGCHPVTEEVEFGCAEDVEAHYYLHDPRIYPECCAAIFQDEECVPPRLSGLQITPFGHDLKNYCNTIHY